MIRLRTVVAAVVCLIVTTAEAAEHAPGPSPGHQLPVWTVVPFVLLLLAIALMPLVAGTWWEHNRHKGCVVVALAIPLAAYLVLAWGSAGWHQLQETFREYAAFITLLGALFIISGGIFVQGSLSGTPLVNTAMLGFGALIASFVGTTGASMLLIRPMLRANESRMRVAHIVVFLIFIVSNCGGLLTPLGDPPLFLGFLHGVPFEWTLRLWPQWLFVNGVLLVIFNVWDQVVLNREERERPGSQLEAVQVHVPLRVIGLRNLAFLAGIIVTIVASGKGWGYQGQPWPFGVAEGVMLLLATGSYFSTPRELHRRNRFTFSPIAEVAILFAGIFVTMAPALLILNVNGPPLGLRHPWQYFWATGILSSFLDNAPTYLTFAATACGLEGIPLKERYLEVYLQLPAARGAPEILAAIACGAVFMGANTYIGNGPNFMVKAIAEENNVRMPGFFAYMLYSCGVLLPVFAVATWLFF